MAWSGESVVSADQDATIEIPVREPFEWSHSLRFVEGFPATLNEQLVRPGELVKAWRVLGTTVVTRIRPAADRPALTVDLAATAPLTGEVRDAVADRVSFFLSVDDDLREFVRTAQADAGFAAVEARLHGYHQVKFGSPAENLVWAILAQRQPLPVAREAKRRLAEAFARPVEAFGATFLPFPALEELAGAGEERLAEVVRNERKSKYLYGTVRRLLDTDESFLRHGDVDRVREALLALPGIGPWSAMFVMVRGLGRMDVLPRDAEILRAAERAYGRPVSEDELVALAAPYAPLEGYWAHYLRAAH